ncbi:MAG: hypothetical protein GXO74_03935 [Calditrichaeota bacterium]|nr:hypothetical protein [Calditrichota bacterium]
MNSQRNSAFEKFSLHSNPIELTSSANGRQYCENVGQKAAILGRDNGHFEAWVFPFKIVSELQFSVFIPRYQKLVSAAAIAHQLINRPEMTTLIFSHEIFTIRLHLLTPLQEPGCLLLFDVDTDTDLELWLQFSPELQPMWPAGLGGQYTSWLDEIHAYLIGEGSRQFYGLIGSLLAEPHSETPGHQLPDELMKFIIPVNGETAAKRILPIAVTGSANSREEAIERYKRLFASIPDLYEKNFAHYQKLRQDFVSIETGDAQFDLAFEWAKIALDKGFVENPQLGAGMVAGYGISGNSHRPGFAWFFGGDTFINSFAINSYGDFENCKKALRFFRDRQRKDGKIPHEIAQSAALIPWFEKYPYAFYHADTTAYFIVAMADYLRKSGDVAFVRESWDSIVKAFQFCLSADEDEDGLMENSAAGLAAMEVGKLLPKTKIDIYLASLWLEAIKSLMQMSEILQKEKLHSESEQLFARALASFRSIFLNPETGTLNFSQLLTGEKLSELTVWQAIPYYFGLIEPDDTLKQMSRADMSTDWGVRSLRTNSQYYDPLNYNNGTVWPFTTGYVAGAHYRQHRMLNGWENLAANAALTFVAEPGWQAELFSGDFLHGLETAVPHQLFSAWGILNPFFHGLLGLEMNAMKKEVKLSPHLPFHWEEGSIRNLRCGEEKFDLNWQRQDGKLIFSFQKEPGQPLQVQFSPALAPGTRVGNVKLNNKQHGFEMCDFGGDVHCELKFSLMQNAVVEIDYFAGVEILLPFPKLRQGERSRRLRFVNYGFSDGVFLLEIEGVGGEIYELNLRTDYQIVQVDGAKLINEGSALLIKFDEKNKNKYETKTIYFHLKNSSKKK